MLVRSATRAAAAVLLIAAACSSFEAAPDPEANRADASPDGAPGGASDASATTDPTTREGLSDRRRWEAVSLGAVGNGVAPFGGAFDGRFLYLSPHRSTGAPSGRVARFDTSAPLASRSAWSYRDLSAQQPGAARMRGAAFDGRHAFFPSGDGMWARLDTDAGFERAASWSFFDPRQLAGGAHGYHGLVFDGRYVYGVPFVNSNPDGGPALDGLTVARVDTTGPFDDGGSWAFHSLPAGWGAHHGGAFDGRFVYFVPHFGDRLVRYDTQKTFTDASSWQSLELASVAGDRLVAGAVFDGRYLHLVPSFGGDGAYAAAAYGRMMRYDTQGPFDASSFDHFDATSVDPAARGFAGGTFDGRFVYFAPHAREAQRPDESRHGVVVRYDTQAPHDAPASWSTFDVATLNPAATNFTGALFDGRWVYFIPKRATGAIVRFDTGGAGALPARSNASFL